MDNLKTVDMANGFLNRHLLVMVKRARTLPDGGNLEQVTEFGGFTSFPEFSPDGGKLVFASSYKAKGNYEFNIFTADWK